MPDILIRNLDEEVIKRLKARAKRNRRSLQKEVKMTLETSSRLSIDEALESARRWRKKLGKKFEDSAELIRQDRQR